MMLLRLISVPYMRKHVVRTLLTLAAIVIGIAVFVAMHTANNAVFETFQETINRIAGATELQVTAGDAGFGEEILEKVQGLNEVRVAAPVIESIVGTRLAGQGNLLILGVDMTGDRSLREYDLAAGDEAMLEDPLVFLAQPDSIILTADFCARNGLGLNSVVPLDTATGAKDFKVRGILKSSGLTSAFGGNLAIMDIYAAQFVFGRGRKFDRIDIALAKGTPVGSAQESLRRLLGVGYEVQPPSTRGQSFQSLLRIYRFMLTFSSLFALIVGMFIIYNTFAIAVTQRRGEIGLLRALGATRLQVSLLLLSESILIAIVGSVAGVLLGQMMAGAFANGAAGLLRGAYGVASADSVPTAFTPWVAILAVVLGVVTSALAAVLPARKAASVDPVKALQKGRSQVMDEGGTHGRLLAAAALAVTGMLIVAFSQTIELFYLGYGCVLSGALLVTPAFALLLARALRPVLRWLRPIEGTLAADSLISAPRRTSATVAALMLSLALVIGLAGTARASYAQIDEWVNVWLNPAFFVTSSPTYTDRSYRFPDSLTADLASVDGIAEVQRLRNVRLSMGDDSILLFAIEIEKAARTSPRRALQGRESEMYALTAEGRGVIASENFATLRRVKVGDTIDIPTPTGPLALPLVGVIREYADQQGSLFIDWELFKKRWNDDGVDLYRVYLKPGVSTDTARQAVLSRFAGNRRLFVLSNAEVRDYVMGLVNQWFTMTWAQIAIAILVAILGIVNSLTVSITDRKRELGMLRALGGFPSQVRWTIWMEALGIGTISVLIGLTVGAIHLYYMLEMTARDFFGLRFDYLYPYGVASALFPIILAAALIGASIPAEVAVRGSLVEALEYE
jgi:putative ABC transport system permease protein